jgi:hypothetical protein
LLNTKINFNILSVFILLSGLQVANLFYVFSDSLYNKGSFISYSLYVLIALISIFTLDRKLLIEKNTFFILSIILLVSSFAMFYYGIQNTLVKDTYIDSYEFKVFMDLMTKIFFFLTVPIFISRLSINHINLIYKYYIYLFFFLVAIALLAYFPVNIQKDKLIFYGGMRFSAFHYELVYFAFSALIILLFYIKKFTFFNILLWFCFAIFVMIITKSNMIPLYIMDVLFVLLIYKISLFRKHYTSILLLLLLLLLLFMIYFLIENIEILKTVSFLFPRVDFDFSPDRYSSNSILSRLSILYSGLSYAINHIDSVPPGLSGSVYMKEYVNSHIEQKQMDGSGITKFIADFSFFSIIIFILIYVKIKTIGRYLNKNNLKYFIIFNMSILTIIFHAGYLNFSIWTWIFLSYRYIKLTKEY